jgi:replicative DNA helicase
MNAPDRISLLKIPQAEESEQAVLGALLLDPASFDRISDRLRPEHFFAHHRRLVYAEIVRQLAAGQAVDLFTVFARLRDQDVTLAELNSWAQCVPSASTIVRHAELVIEAARGRALMSASHEIGSLAVDAEHGIDERIDRAQALLARLSDEAPRDEWVDACAGLAEHAAVLADRAAGRVKSWPTGLSDLDDRLDGGLRPGALYIIGARPSMGKTALGMTIGLHLARQRAVGLLSMEMPHADLRDRMIAMLGRINLSDVIRPAHGHGQALEDAQALSRQLRFHVSDQGGLNINQVRAKARNLKRQHGLDVLIVDYIGLMTGLYARQSRVYQLEEISRGLKTLAKELGIAVVCLAQVNRKVEERVDATPALADLRDSGAIEQDADVVMFIHRPIQSRPDMGPEWEWYARLSVAKNRQGRCGYVNLCYRGEQVRFDNWGGPAPVTPREAKKRGFGAAEGAQ